MTTRIHRRKFIKNTSAFCMGGCILMKGAGLSAFSSLQDDPIIPEQLCYCGYKCPDDCDFYKATLENNVDLKKEVYNKWEFEERHGLEFDPEKFFCYKCKPGDKPEGIVLEKCTVRACAIEKGHEACIECDELKDCNKELWVRFPDFKKHIIGVQENYLKV